MTCASKTCWSTPAKPLSLPGNTNQLPPISEFSTKFSPASNAACSAMMPKLEMPSSLTPDGARSNPMVNQLS